VHWLRENPGYAHNTVDQLVRFGGRGLYTRIVYSVASLTLVLKNPLSHVVYPVFFVKLN